MCAAVLLSGDIPQPLIWVGLTLLICSLIILLVLRGFGRSQSVNKAFFGVTDREGLLKDPPRDGSEVRISERLDQHFSTGSQIAYQVLLLLRNDARVPPEGIRLLRRDRRGRLHLIHVSAEDTEILYWRLIPVDDVSAEGLLEHKDGPFAWLRLNSEGQILEVNRKAEALGYSRELVEKTELETQSAVLKDGAVVVPPLDCERTYAVVTIAEHAHSHDKILVPIPEHPLNGPSLNALIGDIPLPLMTVTAEGCLIRANTMISSSIRAALEPGKTVLEVLDGKRNVLSDALRTALETRKRVETEIVDIEINKASRFLQFNVMPLLAPGQDGALISVVDTTHTKMLEAQFIQGQKMQTVGQLAGGIAHDFNNLLTAITGHCDLLLMRHEMGDSDFADLQQISQNANRAASLVRQLLAFSRKQTLELSVVDVGETVSDLTHLLSRLIGDQVTLKVHRDDILPKIAVDKRQFEQVVLNLAVNARDAMPEGGVIELRARMVEFDSETLRDGARVPPGRFAMVQVADTGVGISVAEVGRVFEPFYTTKSDGKGTGLGLSTAFGIIKQFKGFIFADSRIGLGTTFTVLLPEASEDAPAPVKQVKDEPPVLAAEADATILLAEDEAPVRSFAAKALRLKGYNVIESPSGDAALEMLNNRPDLKPDLIISDVMMPGRDGPAWVREALHLREDMRVIFMSGYAEDVFTPERPSVEGALFLEKPFTLKDLALSAQDALSR